MLLPLRVQIPNRSSAAPKRHYRQFKNELRSDFNACCGYCDSTDRYFGGKSGAHIDHFAPKSKFPALENSYDNLVYSCPFCNRAKSDKWVGNNPRIPNNGLEGFVDPCSTKLDDHLARNPVGEIVPKSELGEFMIDSLHLRLARHRYIWQAQRLDKLVAKLNELQPRVAKDSPTYLELLENLTELFAEIRKYEQRIHDQ